MLKNGFIRKKRLISKFITPQPGQQTTAVYMLTNFSRSKTGNESWSVKRV